jgi:hypothetical protein
MPAKRYDRAMIDFLAHPEIQAVLSATDDACPSSKFHRENRNRKTGVS